MTRSSIRQQHPEWNDDQVIRETAIASVTERRNVTRDNLLPYELMQMAASSFERRSIAIGRYTAGGVERIVGDLCNLRERLKCESQQRITAP